jgi:hypothetical protein
MRPMSADVAELVDRDALRTLISQYAHRIDARDVEGTVACFTVDAHVEFDGGAEVVDGRGNLARFFANAFRGALLGDRGTSTHLLTDVIVTLAGDTARLETQAVAVLASNRRDTVIMRGLRYSDECVRSEHGWLIHERLHRARGQCEAAGGPLGTAARNAQPPR